MSEKNMLKSTNLHVRSFARVPARARAIARVSLRGLHYVTKDCLIKKESLFSMHILPP